MVAEAMFRRRERTWRQLRSDDKHGLGSETISRDALKVALPPCVTDDATILAFRFKGKAPMVGFKLEGVFYILWLDRAFDVYDHGS